LFFSIIKYLIIFVLTIFWLDRSFVVVIVVVVLQHKKTKGKQFCVFVEKFKTFKRQQQQQQQNLFYLFTLSFFIERIT
jgi:hypothetical protein